MQEKERYIVHIDMDAFFASVEQRDAPALKGKPVIVGADPKKGKGRGVVSTCSYEARKFGVRSAMPISRAYRLCPCAVFLPVDFTKYKKDSQELFSILYDFSPDLERVSIDEAFLDITSTFYIFGGPVETCIKIKRKIADKLSLTASLGMAPVKMAAKIASDLKKPDGLVTVSREQLLGFLHPLGIEKIWGLGPKTAVLLHSYGIKTIGQLACCDPQKLTGILGSNGLYFWELANGKDNSIVCESSGQKSMSKEMTFEEDERDLKKLKSALMDLSDSLSWLLRREKLKCRTLTIKLRFPDFTTVNRSVSCPSGFSYTDEIYEEAYACMKKLLPDGGKVRLLGLKASGLQDSDFPDSLFNAPREKHMERLHRAVDSVRGKFGRDAISRGTQNILN